MPRPSQTLYEQAAGLSRDALRALLDAGADPNYAPPDAHDTAFLRRARRLDDETLTWLLDAGADARAADRFDGRSLLHVLAMESARDVSGLIVRLIRAGADVHARDAEGWTALQRAVMFAQHAVIVALLEEGAVAESHGLLEDAVRWPERIAVLVERGAPVVPGPADRRSALHAAVLHRRHASMVTLLDAGVPVDGRTRDRGETPLRMAVTARDHAAARLLLQHGADPTVPDHDGVTPIDIATRLLDAVLAGALVANAEGERAAERIVDEVQARERLVRAREEAVLDRMTDRGLCFRVVTPGFKYEYEDEQRVRFEDGRWWIETHCGYTGRSVRTEATREKALQRMCELCDARDRGPEKLVECLEARIAEP